MLPGELIKLRGEALVVEGAGAVEEEEEEEKKEEEKDDEEERKANACEEWFEHQTHLPFFSFPLASHAA